MLVGLVQQSVWDWCDLAGHKEIPKKQPLAYRQKWQSREDMPVFSLLTFKRPQISWNEIWISKSPWWSHPRRLFDPWRPCARRCFQSLRMRSVGLFCSGGWRVHVHDLGAREAVVVLMWGGFVKGSFKKSRSMAKGRETYGCFQK